MKSHNPTFQVGVSTIGANLVDPHTGFTLSEGERIQQIVQMGLECERLGLDMFAIGESHEMNFVTQGHAIIMASVAAKTQNLNVFSSVSVISTHDPVRMYEDFSTLSLLFPKRIHPVVGRGSRLGSYKLFNVNEAHYEDVFKEKLDLLLQINQAGILDEPVTWQGDYRPSLDGLFILPRERAGVDIWHAVGGSPESIYSAAVHSMPMMLTTLAGPNASYANMIQFYRQHFVPSESLPEPKVITTSWFFADESDDLAVKNFYPFFRIMNKSLRNSDVSIDFLYSCLDENNSMMIGSAETIRKKLEAQAQLFQHDGLLAHPDTGCSNWKIIQKNIKTLAEITKHN